MEEEKSNGNEGQKKEKPSVASRGIPSSESLYLPAHYGGEIRSFQDKDEQKVHFHYSLEEVLNFVFPKKYQAKYYEVALAFMKEINARMAMRGNEIGEFVSRNNISKATFYNRVLPRLKRVGLLKVERETITPQESRRKYRPMTISLSKTFGNYLSKIGESWLALVDDARSRIKKE